MLRDREAILTQLKTIFEEMFEADPSTVVLDANLYEDLDIDSIDAVDLVARLRTLSGKKIEPEQFKSVRTVSDVVESIYALVNGE
jgi:acyl carrier protein